MEHIYQQAVIFAKNAQINVKHAIHITTVHPATQDFICKKETWGQTSYVSLNVLLGHTLTQQTIYHHVLTVLFTFPAVGYVLITIVVWYALLDLTYYTIQQQIQQRVFKTALLDFSLLATVARLALIRLVGHVASHL